MVDIEPEDELTRAHSCKPRINCALDNYIFKRIARPESANRSYHDPAPLAPLTDVEIHENKIMRKMRISWSILMQMLPIASIWSMLHGNGS